MDVENILCKACNVAFPQKSIRTHINRSKECKAGYTDDEIEKLQAILDQFRKKQRAEKDKLNYDATKRAEKHKATYDS